MARRRHKNKHLEAAISHAESRGWRIEIATGHTHVWGRLYCPYADRSGCRVSVWSTPRNAENHAKDICRVVDRCTCGGDHSNADL
ncbi:MAG: hypothetical protein EBT91_00230 [Rhodobacteraceae bacterium]|nr:hypothetical protein [Paracoccaceae bacterium]